MNNENDDNNEHAKGDDDKNHKTPDKNHDVQERARALYCGELLAPMVRASTTPLRALALRYGAHATYTEELVDRSLSATERCVNTRLNTIDYVKKPLPDAANQKKKKRKKQKHANQEPPPVLLRIDPKLEHGRLICQLGTGEPELAKQAALKVHQDVSALDLNMGCPKKFSVSGGMGSALLTDPDRACSIVRTWRDTLPHMPVSAKIRLLSNTNPQPTMDLITALVERGGIHALAIHGRTVGHDAVVPALWNLLEEVVVQTKTRFPQLSVLINGDFYTRQDFVDFQTRTKADGVLLSRPALYNTSLFRRPDSCVATLPLANTFGYDSPLLLDKTLVVQDYLREAVRYDMHYKNVKYVICEMMNNRRAPTPRTPFLLQSFTPGNQTIHQVCNCHSLPELCQLWNVNHKKEREMNHVSVTAPAGEHRYEDGYLLQTMVSSEAGSKTGNCGPALVSATVAAAMSSSPSPKRTKVALPE